MGGPVRRWQVALAVWLLAAVPAPPPPAGGGAAGPPPPAGGRGAPGASHVGGFAVGAGADFGVGRTGRPVWAGIQWKIGADYPMHLMQAEVTAFFGARGSSAGVQPFAVFQAGGGVGLFSPILQLGANKWSDQNPPSLLPLTPQLLAGGSFGLFAGEDGAGRRFRFAVEPRFRLAFALMDDGSADVSPGGEVLLVFGGTVR